MNSTIGSLTRSRASFCVVSQIARSMAIRSEDLVAQCVARQRDECVRQIRAMQIEIDDVHIQGPKSVQQLRDLRETVHLEDRLALADGGAYFTYPGKAAEAAIRQLPTIGQLDARPTASEQDHLSEVALGDQFAAID